MEKNRTSQGKNKLSVNYRTVYVILNFILCESFQVVQQVVFTHILKFDIKNSYYNK